MESGDVMGHEFMGEVVEVGPDCKGALKVGQRVVVPFTIICGECEQCRRGNYSVCERTNRNKNIADKMFGHTTAGLFGYTHLTGGYPGGHADYVRVPPPTSARAPRGSNPFLLPFFGVLYTLRVAASVRALLPENVEEFVQCRK
jgi:threonine dehydrogenase-like Zn-dependent dehydrogenase